MQIFRRISEPEAAVIAINSEAGRMLAMERDLLREMIACYKVANKRPSDKLFATLQSLNALLFDDEVVAKEINSV